MAASVDRTRQTVTSRGIAGPGTAMFFIALAVLYSCWSWSDRLGSLSTDSVYYLVMARSFSPWIAYDAAAAHISFEGHFPPLYPLLLGILNASEDLHRAGIINTGFLIAALLLAYRWLREQQQSVCSSLLIVLCVSLLPGSYLQALYPQSEFLYLLLTIAALLLLHRHERQHSDRLLWAAALAIAAAILTREIGVSLLLPLSLCSYRSGGWRRLWLPVLVSAPLLLLHMAHRAHQGYFDQLASYYRGDLIGSLRMQLSIEMNSLCTGFIQNFTLSDSAPALIIPLAVLMSSSAAARVLRMHYDGIYVAAYVAIVLLWPFPGESDRLMWPILPVVMAQSLVFCTERRAMIGDPRVRIVAACALLGILLIPTGTGLAAGAQKFSSARATAVQDANRYVDWYRLDEEHARFSIQWQQALVSGVSSLGDWIPQQECVLSIKPDWVVYFARRRSTQPPVPLTGEPQFSRMLASMDCRYVLELDFIDQTYHDPMYPLARLEGRAEHVDAAGFDWRLRNAADAGKIVPHTVFVLDRLM